MSVGKVRQRKRARSVVLFEVRWETYEELLRDLEKQRIRLTYDRGTLEIMSPSPIHELYKVRLSMLIRILAEELDIDFSSGGSTTFRWKKRRKGIEPDQCFWFEDAARRIGTGEFEFPRDPPPDLAIEIDIASSSLNRMKIYAALGVPEVWRYDGERITAYRLEKKKYRVVAESPRFPGFPLVRFTHVLETELGIMESEMIKRFRAAVAKRDW